MIHKKRDVFSESKGVLTHSIHNYRDDKLELHPWSVRNSRHVKSELMGQLTSLIQNYRNVKFELIGSEHPLVQYYRHVRFELVRVSKGEEFKTSNNILDGLEFLVPYFERLGKLPKTSRWEGVSLVPLDFRTFSLRPTLK